MRVGPRSTHNRIKLLGRLPLHVFFFENAVSPGTLLQFPSKGSNFTLSSLAAWSSITIWAQQMCLELIS